MFHIKCLSSLKPFGVVGVDQKACGHMYLLMNLLGPRTNVRKCTTLVKRPAIDMILVM